MLGDADDVDEFGLALSAAVVVDVVVVDDDELPVTFVNVVVTRLVSIHSMRAVFVKRV